ncbi:MAG: hypothetical protein KBC47_03885, partial [Candidatus Peribacteraceae bacterium]|nr:hypothetical protein [Candidatus Peribacteraceae bacterium]
RLIAGAIGVVVVLGIASFSSSRFLTGSLLSPTDIAFLLKNRADTNEDFVLTAREIRKELVRIIRDVIMQRAAGDINGDGVTSRADTSAAITAFQALLAATCSNSIVEAGERCDDGDTQSGDGCSATCAIESGYSCTTATPNVCTLNAVCGNGIKQGNEACDDGDTQSGDGCSATCAIETGYSCNTATPNVCTLIPVGNLFVTRTATPSGVHQVLGGTLFPVLGLNFRAEVENIAVAGLQISFQNDTRSVDRLSVVIAGQTFYGTTGECGNDAVPTGTFCFNFGNNGFIVPNGQTYGLSVSMFAKTDVVGGRAGDVVIPRLDTVVTDLSAIRGTVRARGIASNIDLSMNDADSVAEGEIFIGTATPAADVLIDGDHHQIVMSKIVSITNAHTDPSETPIPVDEFVAGRFQITAAPHQNNQNGFNSISPKDIIIDVHAPNVQFDPTGFFISNSAENIRYNCTPKKNTLELITTPAEATGDFHLECTNVDNPLSINVAQGSTNVFKVIVKVTNAQVNPEAPSELGVFLQNVSDYTHQQANNFSYGGSHFRWIDMDAGATTFLWADGIPSLINGPLYYLAPINL